MLLVGITTPRNWSRDIDIDVNLEMALSYSCITHDNKDTVNICVYYYSSRSACSSGSLCLLLPNRGTANFRRKVLSLGRLVCDFRGIKHVHFKHV